MRVQFVSNHDVPLQRDSDIANTSKLGTLLIKFRDPLTSCKRSGMEVVSTLRESTGIL
jgi:hypothetical protein